MIIIIVIITTATAAGCRKLPLPPLLLLLLLLSSCRRGLAAGLGLEFLLQLLLSPLGQTAHGSSLVLPALRQVMRGIGERIGAGSGCDD
jgi:hypothetical protein